MIELMVVLAIIAIGVAVTSLALRDPVREQLEREGVRLAALLEMARAEARAGGVAASWAPLQEPGATHFAFAGVPRDSGLPERWLDPRVQAQIVGASRIVLGPEPILPPQRIVLRLDPHRLEVASDGLSPFAVRVPDGSS